MTPALALLSGALGMLSACCRGCCRGALPLLSGCCRGALSPPIPPSGLRAPFGRGRAHVEGAKNAGHRAAKKHPARLTFPAALCLAGARGPLNAPRSALYYLPWDVVALVWRPSMQATSMCWMASEPLSSRSVTTRSSRRVATAALTHHQENRS